MLYTNQNLLDISLLLLRLFIGSCFIVHGLGKLGIVGKGSMTGFVGWLKSLGVPFPEIQARLAMLSELVGGTLIVFGFCTRLGALVCLATMIVAATVGHKGGGYLITNNPPGNEYTINLAVILVAMILMGPGVYSLDYYLFG